MNFLEKYGIKITNQELLNQALTHSSYANEHRCEDYERLEFLGDGILQAIMSDYFYNNTTLPEGKMSKERAKFVCEDALAYYVKKIGYDKYIKVGHGLEGNLKTAIIADTFESVLAVIYLEHGIEVCKKYIYEVVVPEIENGHVFFKDYKTVLQELVQTDKKSLEYVLVDTKGEAHQMTFTINVVVDGIILGTGSGPSKKIAEQKAAEEALKKSASK